MKFTGKELIVLNEMSCLAFMSGGIAFSEVTESLKRKIKEAVMELSQNEEISLPLDYSFNFRYEELALLGQMISIALRSGQIEFNKVSESIHKKVADEIEKRNHLSTDEGAADPAAG